MSKKLTVFISLFLLISSFTTQSLEAVTKAALDLGSGSFKIVVAEIEDDKIKILFTHAEKTKLGLHLAQSQDNCINQAAQNTALEVLKKLVDLGHLHGATEFSGVATAAMRNAANGKEVLAYWALHSGIKLSILPQDQEAALGFETAAALAPEINRESIISMDLGGASFQLSTVNAEGHDVYEGLIGSSTITKMIIEEIRGLQMYPGCPFTPMTMNEIEILSEKIQAKIDAPLWLQEKLKDDQTKVVYFDCYPFLENPHTVYRDEIWEKIVALSNPDDPRTQICIAKGFNTASILRDLTWLYSIMEKFQIEQFLYKDFLGGNGLGMMREEQFWNEQD